MIENCRKCNEPIQASLMGGSSGIFGTCSKCLKAKQQDQIRAQSVCNPSSHKPVEPAPVITSSEEKCTTAYDKFAQLFGEYDPTSLSLVVRNTEETRKRIAQKLAEELAPKWKITATKYDPVTNILSCTVAIEPLTFPDWITLPIDGSSVLGD